MHPTLRVGMATVLVLLLAGPAHAAVKTSDLMFRAGDEQVKGFLAEPEGKGPFPAIVIIQEWWGLNDWIKENAQRLAAQGYVCLAPDLYHGQVTDDPRKAGELLKGLPPDRALRDLKGSVDALVARENVAREKIGCIGWCMGGGYSLQLALNDPRVGACVMCYGRVVTDADKIKPLRAAVLGIFGEDDRGIPAAGVRQFEQALKKDAKQVERINIYKGAGHGFMRPNNGPGKPNPEYRAEQARDAWKQIDAFFAKTLKDK
jgi:carboxymethylenebutenolidase